MLLFCGLIGPKKQNHVQKPECKYNACSYQLYLVNICDGITHTLAWVSGGILFLIVDLDLTTVKCKYLIAWLKSNYF
jgi:hypothetical protein